MLLYTHTHRFLLWGGFGDPTCALEFKCSPPLRPTPTFVNKDWTWLWCALGTKDCVSEVFETLRALKPPWLFFKNQCVRQSQTVMCIMYLICLYWPLVISLGVQRTVLARRIFIERIYWYKSWQIQLFCKYLSLNKKQGLNLSVFHCNVRAAHFSRKTIFLIKKNIYILKEIW